MSHHNALYGSDQNNPLVGVDGVEFDVADTVTILDVEVVITAVVTGGEGAAAWAAW